VQVDSRIEAWLRLSLVPGLSTSAAHKLLTYFGSIEAVFDASKPSLGAVVTPRMVDAISKGPDSEIMGAAVSWAREEGNFLLTWDDARYPQALLNTPDAPPVIYAKGNLELLNKPSLAIIGSRNCSGQGANTARAFAREVADSGLTVVSGLALGIDAGAHEGALEGAASTIAVLGTGIDRVYPARNLDLAHRIAQKGVLISDYPLGTPPLPINFPRRNRIISGLSKGVLVVEASLGSGSLITAKLAAEQGREVFAIPGSIHSPFSKGCHKLIKEGAKLTESVLDLLSELNWASRAASVAAPMTQIPSSKILDTMGFHPMSVDEMCTALKVGPASIAAELLTLELDGIIESMPGGKYLRKQ
jgi:DNA processing protein